MVLRSANIESEKAIAGRARKAAAEERKKEEEAAIAEAENDEWWKQGVKERTMADVRKEKQEQKRQRKAETNQKKADNLARTPGILDIKESHSVPSRNPPDGNRAPRIQRIQRKHAS